MATTDGSSGLSGSDEEASRLATASFVQLRASPSVDGLIAAGLLRDVLETRRIPYKFAVSMAPAESSGDALTVWTGTQSIPRDGIHLEAGAATEKAAELMASLGRDPEPERVAIGTVFTETSPHGFGDPQPGLGLPVEDPRDGLAHSTLVHASYSGDVETVDAVLENANNLEDREIASLVALTSLEDPGLPPMAGEAIQRLLGPTAIEWGPYPTVEGTADVLDVLAETDPGVALALACGQASGSVSVLEQWRSTARDIHESLRNLTLEGPEGLAVLEVDHAAVAVTARLLRAFHDVPRTVVVYTDDRVAAASRTMDDRALADALLEGAETVMSHGDRRVSGRMTTSPTPIIEALQEGAP